MNIDAEMMPVMLRMISFRLSPSIFSLVELKSKYWTVNEKIAMKTVIEYNELDKKVPKSMIYLNIK